MEYCNYCGVRVETDDWGMPPHRCLAMVENDRRLAEQLRLEDLNNQFNYSRYPVWGQDHSGIIYHHSNPSGPPNTPTRTVEVNQGPSLSERLVEIARVLNNLQQQLREVWIITETEEANRRWEEQRRRNN